MHTMLYNFIKSRKITNVQCRTITYNSYIHTVEYNYLQFSKITYNAVQFHTIQYNYVHCSTITYNAVQLHTMQYNYIRCSTIWYNSVQLRTLQYNYIQCSTIKSNAVHEAFCITLMKVSITFLCFQQRWLWIALTLVIKGVWLIGTGLLVIIGDPIWIKGGKFKCTLSSKDDNARLRTVTLNNQINNVENIVDILG